MGRGCAPTPQTPPAATCRCIQDMEWICFSLAFPFDAPSGVSHLILQFTAKNWRTPAAARLPAPRRLRRLSARSNIEPHEGSRESSPCPLPSLSALCASDPSCDTPSKTHTESASGFRKEPSKGTQSIPRMSLNHPEVCTARREHAPSPGAQRPQSSQGNADRGVWPSRKIRASGRQDSNLRHPAPKAGALPG